MYYYEELIKRPEYKAVLYGFSRADSEVVINAASQAINDGNTLLENPTEYFGNIVSSFSEDTAQQSTIIEAFVVEPPTLSSSASYAGLQAMLPFQGTLQQITSAVESAANIARIFGQGSALSTKSVIGTRLKWENTDPPAFSVNFLFVASDQDKVFEQVVEPATKLLKLTMPRRASASNDFVSQLVRDVPVLGESVSDLQDLAQILAPPNFYVGGTDPSGLFILQIGQWFRAGGLVPESVNVTWAPQVHRTAKCPLYAQVACNFKYFQALRADELDNFFFSGGAGYRTFNPDVE